MAMSERHRRYFDRLIEKRLALVHEMGGVCNYCGETDVTKLEFNHLYKRTWRSEKTSWPKRLRLYRQEWLDEKLDLACGTCNKKLGKPEDGEPDPDYVFAGENDF